MANIDATTPQLKVVKSFLDTYLSLDVSKTESFMSRDFKFQTFPKVAELPDEPVAAHVQRYEGLLAAMTKLEVRIEHQAFELAD